MDLIQKSAQNALELIQLGRHSLTGNEIETVYVRAKALLSKLASGEVIVVDPKEYQKLLDSEEKKPPRKRK